jgi:hypothetical protein
MSPLSASLLLPCVVGRSRYAAEKKIKIGYTLSSAQFRAHIRKEYTMDPTEETRFNELYQRHLGLLKLQGKSHKIICYQILEFIETYY